MWDVVLLLCTTVLLVLWIYDDLPADSADVKAVVANAKGVPGAEQQVKAFLKQHPTPTMFELAELRKQINEEVVLATAKTVTGDASLKSATEQKAKERIEQQRQEAEIKQASLARKPISEMSLGEVQYLYWPKFLFLSVMMAVAVMLVKAMQNAKNH